MYLIGILSSIFLRINHELKVDLKILNPGLLQFFCSKLIYLVYVYYSYVYYSKFFCA